MMKLKLELEDCTIVFSIQDYLAIITVLSQLVTDGAITSLGTETKGASV